MLADNNVTLEFVGTSCFIKARRTRIILLEGVAKRGLHKVKSPSSHPQSVAVNTISLTQNKFQYLFACFPHSTCETFGLNSFQENKKSCLSVMASKVVYSKLRIL